MTYKELSELPAWLRKEFPQEAQEIYRAAYNLVYERSMALGHRQDAKTVAQTAHRAALLAVETEFEKDPRGRWQRAPLTDDMDKHKLSQAPDGETE